MAGGFWTGQNKVLPGVYINTKSADNIGSNVGTRGVVAICEPMSWGETGVIEEYTPGESLIPYIGYDLTHDNALFMREMLKGSATTTAPIKVLLYRPEGTGGVAASAAIAETFSVTAKYAGVRGNDITIVVQASADTEGEYIVETVVDGTVMDSQTSSDATALVANEWVTFDATAFTATAGTALTGGVDPTVSTSDYSAFLTALEGYQFDILVYDGDNETTKAAYAAFVKRISENSGFKCQTVVASATGLDSEYVISVYNGVILSDGTTLTAGQATWWVGGTEAGALYNESLTYSRYPGATAANPKLSETQIETAVSAGNIVFSDTFGVVKVVTDINTLTSFTVDKGEEYRKNRVMRVINTFCNDVYERFSLYYIGKVDNDEYGRSLLKGWIVGYLNTMQANGGVQNFTADDVSVEAGTDVDAVVINVALQPVDSVEKIYMTVTVSVSV